MLQIWNGFPSLWRQRDTSVCLSLEIYFLSPVRRVVHIHKKNGYKRLHNPLCPFCSFFFPALWFHNTLALQFGVGVNVFWRHLPVDSYNKKDPYGNKDPVAAARALQALERALNTLDELPSDYRDFYGRRMIQCIQKRTFCSSMQEDCDTTLPSVQFTKPGWVCKCTINKYEVFICCIVHFALWLLPVFFLSSPEQMHHQ